MKIELARQAKAGRSLEPGNGFLRLGIGSIQCMQKRRAAALLQALARELVEITQAAASDVLQPFLMRPGFRQMLEGQPCKMTHQAGFPQDAPAPGFRGASQQPGAACGWRHAQLQRREYCACGASYVPTQ